MSTTALPMSVCIRVTRACNAKCGFCLAPPDRTQISTAELLRRLRWIAQQHISGVTFCGGEPTVRHDLPQLLDSAREYQLLAKLTTNGILITDDLIKALGRTGTRVKVSVHGPREVHNDLLGVRCYERTVGNLDRMLAAGVLLSVQTIVTAKYRAAIEFAVEFCLDKAIPKVSFVPFIPRGRGLGTQGEYGLSGSEKAELKALALRLRDDLRGQLDIRWLDFATRDYYVVETGGSLEIQRETEASDSILGMLDDR